MGLQRQADGLVVADHLLRQGRRRQRQGRRAIRLLHPHGREQRRGGGPGQALGGPQGRATGEVQGAQGVGGGQGVQGRGGQPCAGPQVVDIGEGPAGRPRRGDRHRPLLAEPVQLAKAQAQGQGGPSEHLSRREREGPARSAGG